jgi:hypothetical protein
MGFGAPVEKARQGAAILVPDAQAFKMAARYSNPWGLLRYFGLPK